MDFSEEEIKRAASLKLWVESRMEEIEAEAARLKEVEALVNGVLRGTSFKSASNIPPATSQAREDEGPSEEYTETRTLKRTKDGLLLGNVYTSGSALAIVPASKIKLRVDTPPFKSFFLNRILEGMKTKDNEKVRQGDLRSDEVIGYEVVEEEGLIKKVEVTRYNDKARLNEIINTAIWAFTRMLEKKEN